MFDKNKTTTLTQDRLKTIDAYCEHRMIMGELKYGTFMPHKCTRNMYKEMYDEAADWRNYIDMELQKLGFRDDPVDVERDLLMHMRVVITRKMAQLTPYLK